MYSREAKAVSTVDIDGESPSDLDFVASYRRKRAEAEADKRRRRNAEVDALIRYAHWSSGDIIFTKFQMNFDIENCVREKLCKGNMKI